MLNLPPRHPWEDIDASVADLLREEVSPIVTVATSTIIEAVPSLGGDLGGPYGDALRDGIRGALDRFLDLAGTADPALNTRLADTYAAFGAREERHGNTLDALLTAYRLGAGVTWTHFANSAVRHGAPTTQIINLANAIYAYIDELGTASAAGFAAAQAGRAGARDVARARLVEALLAGEAASAPARVQRLSAAADWVLPRELAVGVVTPAPSGQAPSLSPDVLTAAQDEDLIAVLTPADAARFRRVPPPMGEGTRVYVGTLRPPDEAAVSLAHARALMGLAADARLTSAVLVAADHLSDLLLRADPVLTEDLRRSMLAPLQDLPARRRDAGMTTLAAWLITFGDRAETARLLGVHPQTVSYRLTWLAETMGSALTDPGQRFALMLALSEEAATLLAGRAHAPER